MASDTKSGVGSKILFVLTYPFNLALEGLVASILFICQSVTGSRGSCKKNPYFTGNFAPVREEIFSEDLVVKGKLPPCVDGLFVRTGPNPYFDPVAGYHWFDGDGMLHACRIKDGKVTYTNHFIKTDRLEFEKKLKRPFFSKIGDLQGVTGLLCIIKYELQKKLGWVTIPSPAATANTALALHADKLFALNEGDLPYTIRALCDGAIETLTRYSFGGELTHSFTAHPKVDPITGEMFFFGYGVEAKPYIQFGVADAKGKIVRDFGVDIPQPIMMHDCAITETKMIFLDCPLIFDPKVMISKGTLPFLFEDRPTRFGVMDRNATDAKDIKWFEQPRMMIFHTANAWDAPDGVHLLACCHDEFDLAITASNFGEDGARPRLREFIFNLADGSVTQRQISNVAGDFPQIRHTLTGRKSRYTWLAMFPMEPGMPLSQGIIKMDTSTPEGPSEIGTILHGPKRWGGEAYFVPSNPDSTDPVDEDAGYLVTYVHDEGTGVSSLLVYDAKSMAPDPVAEVALPQRIPYGFHCLHLNEKEFQGQLKGGGAPPIPSIVIAENAV